MEEAAMAETDSGFVLDVASGLYYHASSGFYYDAKAGWYYSTRDGKYYTFENDTYVPLASANSHENDPKEQVVESTVTQPGFEDNSESEAIPASEKEIYSLKADITQADSTKTSHVANPEFCPNEGLHVVEDLIAETGVQSSWNDKWPSQANGTETDVPEEKQDTLPGEDSGRADVLAHRDSREEGFERDWGIVDLADPEETPEETRPASVWIAEALTELYLQNNLGATPEADEQASLDDYASQNMFYQQDSNSDQLLERAQYNRAENFAGDTVQDIGYRSGNQWQENLAWDVEASSNHGTNGNELHESDDESEELEEGEWRPEEGEREKYVFEDYEDEIEDGEIRDSGQMVTWESQGMEAEPGVDAYNGEHSNGVLSLPEEQHISYGQGDTTDEASMDLAESHADPSELRMVEEEQWRALYIQAAKPRVRSYVGSIDLWDWTTVEQERKVAKKKKTKVIIRLVGRLAPSSSQIHPSLGGSGGFIRTSPVCEVDHEFVKVSSGRIYKLRRPSSKHLSSAPGYISANPTHDWGFPIIITEAEETETESENTAGMLDTPKSSVDMVVSKPFIPNTGHWKFRPAALTKRTRAPALDASLRTLTQEEVLEIEQRKQRYRDRAAERRILHGGFGLGPGQKGLPEHEIEKQEAEAATEMPAALAKAALARPLGRNNVGKRMLEGMGWKEGETLGPGEGGLVNPILAIGNSGRTGLGWG